jgi:hypothetical protein
MKQTRRYVGSLLNDAFSVDYIGAMIEWWVGDDELERIWLEAVVALF